MQSTKHRNPLDPISARKPSALDLLLIISSYTLLLSHPIFLAGTDFGQIGPAVSAAVNGRCPELRSSKIFIFSEVLLP